jgi:hypothetical protein
MHIYIDIETAATTREDIIARVTDDIGPPSNYGADAAAKWWKEKGIAAKAKAVSETALSGLWGSIIAIGFAVDDGEPHVVTADTEAALIEGFEMMLRSEVDTAHGTGSRMAMWDSRACWVGHNIEAFDLRYIWQRSRITGAELTLPLPLRRQDSHRRFDTMLEWAGWGNRVAQRDLELAFGLERNDPLERGGADVHQALQEGRLRDVVAHCKEDIRLVREIHRRLAA